MTDIRTRIMTAISDAAYAARFLSSEEQPGRFADIANDCEVDVRDILKREPAQAVAWWLGPRDEWDDTLVTLDNERADRWRKRGRDVRPLVFGDTPQPSAGAVTEAMERALRTAASTFFAYAALHEAKGTPEGIAKAAANRALGQEMVDALTAAREVPSDE